MPMSLFPKQTSSPSQTSRRSLLALLCAFTIGMSACGSDSEPVSAGATETDSAEEADVEEDHSDEDGDDHSDEDHDEDHSDEDHDDDHDHDDESSSLGAHEHGTAEMTVTWIDGDVTVELISPNFNVFGFEYEPESDEDIATEADRIEALTAPEVITINGEAGCSLEGPASTEIERDGSHSEITVSWAFTCESPDEIEQLDATALFDAFPNFEDVDVQWISDSGQSAGELTPSETTLALTE